MKLTCELVAREIAGELYLVPIGDSAKQYPGLFALNEIGAFIWKNIEDAENEDQLVKLVLDEYDVDSDTASADVKEFIDKLKAIGIIE